MKCDVTLSVLSLPCYCWLLHLLTILRCVISCFCESDYKQDNSKRSGQMSVKSSRQIAFHTGMTAFSSELDISLCRAYRLIQLSRSRFCIMFLLIKFTDGYLIDNKELVR